MSTQKDRDSYNAAVKAAADRYNESTWGAAVAYSRAIRAADAALLAASRPAIDRQHEAANR